MSRKLTIGQALGPQHKGTFPLEKLLLTDQKIRELYDYRMDVLRKIDPRLGLSFAPDSTLPWLNPARIKIHLGRFKAFSVEGWMNVCDPSDPDPRSEFMMPLDLLKLKEETVDFISAPFVIHRFANPVNAIRNWLACLRSTGSLFIAIEDQYELLRAGHRFELDGHCKTEDALKKTMIEAGCHDLVRANFEKFDLVGYQPFYRGYFAFKTPVKEDE